MAESELELVAELIGLMEELGTLADREGQIRQRCEAILGLLSPAIEAREGFPQPVKIKPAKNRAKPKSRR